MRILVADDSKTNLALTTVALNRLGHEVIGVNSGEEAVCAFNKTRPDLIILDVVMKNIDGFECARQIRAENPDDWIPIIFLSASVDDASIAKGIRAGGDDYLTKPFSEITLEAKIHAMQRIAEMRNKLCETMKKLLTLSSTDSLTGVYNRHQFEITLNEKISEANRHHYTLALLFLDLDHFKTINDTIGHHVGDLILKEVAQRIKSCTRLEDFVARLGGDEFAILISHKDKSAYTEQIAHKILNTLAQPFNVEGNTFHISASIGVAYYPDENTDASSLVANADIAMYHAKEVGRNNFQFFSKEINAQYKQQISLEQDLHFALERNEFFIVYQPIYNLLSKEIVSVEALLRWKHPEFGVISPNIFIPIAEENFLIVEIGLWVLRKVCEQAAHWYKNRHRHFKVSINLSLHQFLQADFMQKINIILDSLQLPPSLLELELTENTIVTYTSQLKDVMKKLRTRGIGIAIDDFGTRYSFLSTLGSLPISTLKIDKAFLDDVLQDPKNNIIVKSLIALGKNLGLNIIAEGVESEEQLHFLVVNGCLYGQGFFLSKPVLPEEITELLATQEKNQKAQKKHPQEETQDE